MNAETRLFDGRAWKHTLPEAVPAAGAVLPRLKRLNLPQGELAQFYDGAEGIRYIAFIELKSGIARGNHYHKVKREFVYVLRGTVALRLENLATRLRAELRLEQGDLAFIDTAVAHTLHPVTEGQAIEFSPEAFDAADIHRHEVLPP